MGAIDEILREQGVMKAGDAAPPHSVTGTQIVDGTITTTDIGTEAVETVDIKDLAVTTGKLAAGCLSNDATGRTKMADGFLSADAAGRLKMADDFVTEGKILNGAVTANKLNIAPGAITGVMIQNDAVDNTKLANMTVGTVKVGGALDAPTDLNISAAGAIPVGQGAGAAPIARTLSGDATMAATGAVTIADDAVTNAKLANITAGSVKCGGAANAPTDVDMSAAGAILIGQGAGVPPVAAVLSQDVVNNAAGQCTIQNLAVTTAKIADDAVDNNKLANMTAGRVKCGGVGNAPTDVDCSAAGAVVFGQGVGAAPVAAVIAGDVNVSAAGASVIQALAVETGMINDLAVTEGKIAGTAVTTGKIALLAVDTGQLADGAVETLKIDDLAVTSGKLADLAVATGKLANDAVDGTKLGDGVVTGIHPANLTAIIAGGAATPGCATVYWADLPNQAANTDITVPFNFRVTRVWGFKTDAAGGGAGATIQVLNAANAITDAISLNIGDQAVFVVGTINDAFATVAGAGTLRITQTNAGPSDSSCEVFIEGIKVA